VTAGGETTTNLIGNALLALLRNPAELARVIADPLLIPAVVEETLRYDPPVPFVIRLTTAQVPLAGATLPAGVRVIALLASANRDENFYPDPDRFYIDRTPRPHAAFGAESTTA
jgi:cytochrome P450